MKKTTGKRRAALLLAAVLAAAALHPVSADETILPEVQAEAGAVTEESVTEETVTEETATEEKAAAAQESTAAEAAAEEKEEAPAVLLTAAAEEPRVTAVLNEDETRVDLKCTDPEPGYTYRFALWSSEGGQDDLIWISGTVKNGSSVCSAKISNFRHPGKYFCHCYARNDATGAYDFVAADTFTVSKAKATGLTVSDCDPATGEFTITAEGLTSVCGFDSLYVAVWCASDQSDLKWYDLEDGKAVCSLMNHKLHSGTYIAHLYTTDGNGFEYFLASASKTLGMPKGFFADINDGSIRAAVGGLPADNGYTSYNFAVWTEDKGQDDLRWYRVSGTPAATIPLSNHQGYGRILIHCYATTASGKSEFVGGGSVTVKGPSAGGAEMTADPDSSAFTIRITDAEFPTGLTALRAAVWSTSNQSNLKWYSDYKKEADGSYVFKGDFDNHGNLMGRYIVHVYMKDGTGRESFLVSCGCTVEASKGSAASEVDAENGQVNITVTGLKSYGVLTSLRAAVWSAKDGQDDLKWIPLQQADGVWTAGVDLSDFPDGGNFLVHVYGYEKNGASRFIGYANFFLAGLLKAGEPEGGSIPVTISHVPEAGSGSSLTLQAWTAEDESDLKEYPVAAAQSEVQVNVPLAHFGSAMTVYHFRTVVSYQNSMMTAAAADRDLRPVAGTFTVTPQEGGAVFLAEIDGAQLHGMESEVRFAVWSEADSQDDLVWYTARKDGGKYTVAIPMRNHKGLGTYHIHVYFEAGEEEYYLQKTTFTLDTVPKGSVSAKNINRSAGTYRLTAVPGMTDIEIERVRVAVWSEPDQSNLVWYDMAEQTDGSFAATVNLKNHDLLEGTYINHVYAYDAEGNGEFIGLDNVEFRPENYVKTELLSDDVCRITLINASMNGHIPDEVAFPTWSKEGGQDDIQWNWTESDGSGTFTVTVNRSDYAHSGTFYTHIYGEYGGNRTVLGSTTYRLYNTGEFDDHAREVMRKILYAVETGGQVYGNCRYNDFTMAYTNSSNERAITIGAGCWYATEAKNLLTRIQLADPVTFARLDTAGIAYDLVNCNWSTYGGENGERTILKGSDKAVAIQNIISTDIGKQVQDQLLDEQSERYVNEAIELGVTDLKAAMFCANIRHLGGLSAMRRVITEAKADNVDLTMENIYTSMRAHNTNPNGVGADLYNSRHVKVMQWLNTYL